MPQGDQDQQQVSSQLTLRDVTKRFGSVTAIDDLSLDVAGGEVVVLLGPSGCGKTTLLRLLAGFERQDEGTISIGNEVVAGGRTFVPPERRPVNVVFQSYALWPHMTVFDNVAFGPRLDKGLAGPEVEQRVAHALALVELEGLGVRYPHQLSGGQQQRVALARAIVGRPSSLLLDEPLSNLDTRLRDDMRLEIKRIQRELNVTMVYVTHDPVEALSLADRIVALHDGRIEQVGTPEDIYHHPRTRYVAASLGTANFLEGTVVHVLGPEADVELSSGAVVRARHSFSGSPPQLGDRVVVSIRPDALGFVRADAAVANGLRGVVTESMFFGDHVQYVIDAEGFNDPLRTTASGSDMAVVGERVELAVKDGLASILAIE